MKMKMKGAIFLRWCFFRGWGEKVEEEKGVVIIEAEVERAVSYFREQLGFIFT